MLSINYEMSVLVCQVKYKSTRRTFHVNLSGVVRRYFEAIKTILLALVRTSVDSVSLTNGKASLNMYQLFTELLLTL